MGEQDNVCVRDAIPSDFPYIAAVMNNTLAEHYGGDHLAHARRIFRAHMDGHIDRVGQFSVEQRTLIATIKDDFAGMLHVVGKRQGTYKISPLIVARDYRGEFGVGSKLLAHAEEYAKRNGARELYCTVTGHNGRALRFFEDRGFLCAGMAEGYYKIGMREYLMYKPLGVPNGGARPQWSSVRFAPFTHQYTAQAKRLILSRIPQDFQGIDSRWVDALLVAYARRQSNDIHLKYCLIYILADDQNDVWGIVAATPKKGGSIKLMPFVGSDSHAFEVMLKEVPEALGKSGHKMYAHLVPSVAETISLQRAGWSLDAVMPAAYHSDRVTQQWSRDLI
jgi:ribosomal protein S18 acetylase RimI-like enzyme